MIYVTHDQIEALTLADRIAVMNQGVIQQLADPREIYRRPVNRFVAAFVGSPGMNFVDGTLSIGQGKAAIVLANGARVALDGYEFTGTPRDGQTATLGIRPEHVRLDQNGPALSRLPIALTLTESMGADSLAWGRVAGKSFAIRIEGEARLSTPADVDAFFPPAQASIFDQKSGARL